jgi:hypothetical protein
MEQAARASEVMEELGRRGIPHSVHWDQSTIQDLTPSC